MTYLLVLILLTFVVVCNSLTHRKSIVERSSDHALTIQVRALEVSLVMVFTPLITTILIDGSSILQPLGNIVVALSAVGSAIILATGLRWLLKAYKLNNTAFKAVGTPAVLSISGGILLMGCIQHFTFNTSDGGVLYIANLPSDLAVNDVDCPSGLLLIDAMPEADSATVGYRCPTAFVLLNSLQTPFVPWPDYHQGKSADVANVIQSLVANANEVPVEK